MGAGALAATTSANYNVAIGVGALGVLTSAVNNTALGAGALQRATTGVSNIAIGTNSLYALVSDSNNVIIGVNAATSLNGAGSATKNISMGNGTFSALTTGSSNVAIGDSAGGSVTVHSGNVFIGQSAGSAHNDDDSVYIGYQAFQTGTGTYNTIIGGFNTAVGMTGGYNTMIGAGTGTNLTGTCQNNCWVTSVFTGPSAAANNSTVLGSTASGYVDAGLTNSNEWSFCRGSNALGLHVYNTTDGLFPPTVYERAVLDWNVTANVFTIGTQKGSTGVLRNIQFVQGATNILDYGVTTANVWTASAQITCTAAIKSTYRIASVPVTYTGTSVVMGTTDNSIIINASGTFTLTLLGAAAYPGRILYVKSIAAQIVNSGSSNVVPIGSATAGTAIFPATAGKYAVLQSDGSNWITLASN
jgi:hypothetical protein